MTGALWRNGLYGVNGDGWVGALISSLASFGAAAARAGHAGVTCH